MNSRIRAAESLMNAFAERTGLMSDGATTTRYLWTDAFGVFALLALHQLTGKKSHLDTALRLVDQVHHVLGRFGPDDSERQGWISGLDETNGELHPTAGGLRIGKPLRERRLDEPYNDRLEWERDGQYFHYLTKWMHALNRITIVTGDTRFNDWALELADAAHCAFVYRPDYGGPRRIYWKMSTDLSRPQIASMGQHDALDGIVTFTQLDETRRSMTPSRGPDLKQALADLYAITARSSYATNDELGAGELLVAANQIARLIVNDDFRHTALLDTVLMDAHRCLQSIASTNRFDQPPHARIPFRELGLAIGLDALAPMHDCIARHAEQFRCSRALCDHIRAMEALMPQPSDLQRYWMDTANQNATTWTEHRDINSVMLATALVPDVYLLCDAASCPACASPSMTPAAKKEPNT